VDEQCEKLQKWRLNYQKSGNRDTQGRSDFGHQIQELNAFKIKEQGKCFDLGRAGRDLLMIRGENIDKTEEYLQVDLKGAIQKITLIYRNCPENNDCSSSWLKRHKTI
jgi:hypothetical protein